MARNDQLEQYTADPRLFQAVLNEVLNGFGLENLDNSIGMSSAELHQLLEHLNELPNNAEIKLKLTQTKALRNALRETLRELGVDEFHTRTGFDFEEGEDVLSNLNHFLRSVESRIDE